MSERTAAWVRLAAQGDLARQALEAGHPLARDAMIISTKDIAQGTEEAARLIKVQRDGFDRIRAAVRRWEHGFVSAASSMQEIKKILERP